jgi:hypothetical protein
MPTWLSDPPTSLYLLLGAAGGLALLAAYFLPGGRPKGRGPKPKGPSPRAWLIAIGALALLLLFGLGVCDWLYESDREQIVRKLHEMSEGVREKDLDRSFRHVSDSFHVGQSGKAQFRSLADQAVRSGQVTDIAVWDVVIEPIGKDDTKAKVRFRFKPKGGAFRDEVHFIGKAVFVREADGQWRLLSFEVFIPPNERDPVPLPL